MDTSAHLESVVAQTTTFAEWVQGQDPATRVPTCPKWSLAELVGHVGGTQRMVATLVGQRLTDPSAALAAMDTGPADPAGWRAWLTGTAAAAADAFGSVDDSTPVWDPSGGDSGVPFWARRLFGEITVHRADAAGALGEHYDVSPDHAAATIDDWLETMTSPGYAQARPEFVDAIRDTGRVLHFHATDSAHEWLVRRTPDLVVLERAHAEADATVRGPAAELLLVLTRRRPLDAARNLDLHGDRASLDHWIEHMDWVAG
ncbi:maleylpyruvate isomerase family mycothiol-dependent enzyme [Amycolatopsis sp. WQ 127309]|uniref:maleylpyruvate isomerase family mycothiol-dependent enzyme n=1 Tax=Amycolatopsis sp. WQ 127309 TaxID=2932773 RepID=UPI001FF27172|nr:maleylpyruvate isomerase family mycothiol-dependent enzyme [Amycolatopsis sp. WQ 127309]UOZ06690.1 maleylpyruvate isomerase family mycothiol-dependent enzyme [Amycolatopsis sp. WQ 127309]